MHSQPHDLDSALTADLANRLVESLSLYPTRETAAASCGLAYKTVENWVRRGQSAHASPVLQLFSAEYLSRESAHSRDLYRMYLMLVQQGIGNSGAGLLKIIQTRWPGTGEDILSTSGDGPRRTDDLRAMLLRPSPRLRAMLRETGWVRAAGDASMVKQLPASPSEPIDEE